MAFDELSPCAPDPILASVGAEALVRAGGIAPEEPAAALGSRAPGGVNESGNFGGEALPQSGAER